MHGRSLPRAWLAVSVVGLVVACGGPSGGAVPTVVEYFRAASVSVERGADVALEWSVTDPGTRAGVDSCALLRQVEGEAWSDSVGVPCVGSHVEVPPSPSSASSVAYRLRVVKQPADAADPFVTRDVTIDFVVPTVTIAPASASLEQGDGMDFTASVAGAVDTSVTWSASSGTIDGSGSTITYTAPMEAGTFSLTATSVADPSASASASITVAGVEVSIDPTNASVLVGGTVEFTVTVAGTSETGVSWTASCGSISGSGSSVTFVAPDFTGSCTVTAASTADPTASASAVVSVGAVAVAIDPTSASLDQGASRSFTATVTGADDPSVTWSVSGGSITGSGNTVSYTSPMEAGSFTVTATSVEAPDVRASASVTVPEIVVSITPTSATVLTGETAGFSASVTGAADTSLAWSASSGSISGSGSSVTYTAPSTAGTTTVTAASVADPSATASASVTVELVGITIDPTTAEVETGETVAFIATITGTSDTRVSWDASCGSISGSGTTITFLAPDFAGSCTITATSQRDPRRTATATANVEEPLTGDLLWTRDFGSAGIERLKDVWLGDDGSVLLVGTTTGNVEGEASFGGGLTDGFLVRYDPDGVPTDVVQLAGPVADTPLLVRPQSDGRTLVGGAVYGTPDGATEPTGHLFLRWIDRDVLTTDPIVEFGTVMDARDALAMTLDGDGNVLVAGSVMVPGTVSPDALLQKFDVDGNLLWRTVIPMYVGSAKRVDVNDAGRIAITGSSYKHDYVAVLDAEGSLEWSVHFDMYTWVPEPAIDTDGSVVVAMTDRWQPTVVNLIKYDPDGQEVWRRDVGNAGSTSPLAVDLAPDGTILVAGRTSGDFGTGVPGGSTFVSKHAMDGTRIWVQQYGVGRSAVLDAELAVDASGRSVVGEAVSWSETDPDYDLVTTLRSP